MKYDQQFQIHTMYHIVGREDDLYDITVSVLKLSDEEGVAPTTTKLTTIEGWTSGQVFAKLGIRVPEPFVDPNQTPEERVVSVLEEALSKAGSRTIVTTTELNDILLDALNAVGGKRVDTAMEGATCQ